MSFTFALLCFALLFCLPFCCLSPNLLMPITYDRSQGGVELVSSVTAAPWDFCVEPSICKSEAAYPPMPMRSMCDLGLTLIDEEGRVKKWEVNL